MATRFGLRMLATAVVCSTGAACYTYQPVEAPLPGTQVRAALTVEGAVRQSEYLGEPIRSLTGRFVSDNGGDVRLDVITSASRGTFNDIVLRDTLAIPATQIVMLEEREISWIRTGIVFTAAAVIGGFAISSLTGGGEDIDTTGGPPPPVFDRVRFPLIRFGWE